MVRPSTFLAQHEKLNELHTKRRVEAILTELAYKQTCEILQEATSSSMTMSLGTIVRVGLGLLHRAIFSSTKGKDDIKELVEDIRLTGLPDKNLSIWCGRCRNKHRMALSLDNVFRLGGKP